MAKRFIVINENISLNDKDIKVVDKEIHHVNVLRHKIGDVIVINEYVVKITKLLDNELYGEVIELARKVGEPSINIKLYQSYLKSDKMEYVVQKSVELGVKSVIPLITKNCVVKLDNKDKSKKIERLNKISIEASKQCGRTDIVDVEEIIEITDNNLVEELNKNDINILAYENSKESLKETVESIVNREKEDIKVGVIVGPEGGFDHRDIEKILTCNNVRVVSLGERILRAETASLYLLSVISYEIDN